MEDLGGANAGGGGAGDAAQLGTNDQAKPRQRKKSRPPAAPISKSGAQDGKLLGVCACVCIFVCVCVWVGGCKYVGGWVGVST